MRTTISFVVLVSCAMLMIALSPIVRKGNSASSRPVPPSTAAKGLAAMDTVLTKAGAAQPQIAKTYGKLPLSFEANRGQTDPRVKFLSRGPGYGVFLTSAEAILSLGRTEKTIGTQKTSALQNSVMLRVSLAGGNQSAHITGLDELPGKTNYFLGNDPRKWRTNVPTYARVKYENVYPGVDLIYYGNQQDLESDFVVAPSADPGVIRLRFRGVNSIKINHEGDLVLKLRNGETLLRKPVAYQQSSNNKLPANDSGKHFFTARYVLENAREVAFAVEGYDAREPLIIDPVLVYSTYLGGSGYDFGTGIAVDASGSAYVTGSTTSTDFPTAGPIQSSYHPSGKNCVNTKFDLFIVFPCPDAFVTKLNPTGTAVLYSTYLGGSDSDAATSIAVDSFGNAYLAGQTNSTDFPTMSPVQGSLGLGNCGVNPVTGAPVPCSDAFVAKLNPTGDAIVFSTYLGGSGQDAANAVAVDSSGSAYVAGITASSDFPTTPGAFGTINFGLEDAFVTKFDPSGAKLLYSSYLGGSGTDYASSIALDSSANAYVTGVTYSTDFPTTPGAFDTKCGTDGACNPNTLGQLQADSFVAKLDPTGSKLVYSTYLGGSGSDAGTAIGVDASGNAYVTGSTASTDFPTQNPIQPTSAGIPAGYSDAFVTKLNPTGSALVYSTYLDGSFGAYAQGIAVDSSGDAYVTGGTLSTDFPISSPVQAASGGDPTAFVANLDPTGSKLIYSTYLGGSGNSVFQIGTAITVDASGSAFVTGSAVSNFPVTLGSFMTAAGGGRCVGQSPASFNPPCSDAFVVKIDLANAPGFAVAPASLNFGAQAVSTSATQNVNLLDAGSQPLTISNIALSGTNPGDFSETTTCPVSSSTLWGGTNCTISLTFSPQTLGTKSAALVVTDDAAGNPHSIPLTGVSATPPTAVLSPSSLAFGSLPVGNSSSPQNIMLTNTGGAPLQISSANLTTSFELQGAGSGAVNCDIPPVTVNGGASCEYAVVFVPQSAGPVTGALSFADNAAGSPQTVALSGTGQDFTLTSTSTSATINAGQTASFTISVTPESGFSQGTNLSCSLSPVVSLGPACSVTPTSVTPTGSTVATATVTVTTTSRTSSSAGLIQHTLFPSPRLWTALACIPALACVFIGAPRRRSALCRRAWAGIAAVLLLAVLSFGCGGGSSSTKNGTPAGSYTLTVTGTSGSLAHTINLTLNVN